MTQLPAPHPRGLPTFNFEEAGPASLGDAEAQIVRLNKLDLIVRLKKAQVIKHVRDASLYREENYGTFDEWVRYSPRMANETPAQVNELVALYEVFVEALHMDPSALQQQHITYTALRTILPFVDRARDEEGQLQVFNPEVVVQFLQDAQHLSAIELRRRISNELAPAANRSMLRFTRVDLIDTRVLVDIEAVDSDVGVQKAGSVYLPLKTYQVFRDALVKDGRLVLAEDVESPKLRRLLQGTTVPSPKDAATP